jgi:L-alanine-DL-glutamate epimerase-like enolase superfamily enzyme
MKIASFNSQILNVPEDEPLAGAVEKEGSTRPIVILTLATDDGIEGIGVSFYGGALTRTLKSAIDQLCELCIGEDPHRVEAIIRKLRDAPAALPAACSLWRWRRSTSRCGTSAARPSASHCGDARRSRNRVPVCASGAPRRGLPLDTVVKAAAT